MTKHEKIGVGLVMALALLQIIISNIEVEICQGIVLKYLPYVLLIGFATCWVFFKKDIDKVQQEAFEPDDDEEQDEAEQANEVEYKQSPLPNDDFVKIANGVMFSNNSKTYIFEVSPNVGEFRIENNILMGTGYGGCNIEIYAFNSGNWAIVSRSRTHLTIIQVS